MISNILFLRKFSFLDSFCTPVSLDALFFGSFPASFVDFNRTMFCLHIKFCLIGPKVFYTHLGVSRETK